MTTKNNRYDSFYGFIESSYEGSSEREAELKAAGFDTQRVSKAVAGILARSALQKSPAKFSSAASGPAWLERAKKAQSSFEAKIKGKSTWISQQYHGAKELAAAVASGKLGMPVQAHAGVFFRDRSMKDISEKDLKSFLDDCELLGLLHESDGDEDKKKT